MHREISELLLYGGILEKEDSVLSRLGEIFRRWEEGERGDVLLRGIHAQVRRLLEAAFAYGFDGDLWQCYLTWLILSDENPFSMSREGRGAASCCPGLDGLAMRDFETFRRLFAFDFGPIESSMKIDCFSKLKNFEAGPARRSFQSQSVGTLVREMSEKFSRSKDAGDMFDEAVKFYRDHGAGVTGFNRAFHVIKVKGSGGALELQAIQDIGSVSLKDIIGYEAQKRALVSNTEAFIAGRPANNVLLYGDSGTGKSTSVRALVNDYFDSGLRVIEIYRSQFRDLAGVMSKIKGRNYRFIIFIDDLSFEEHETEYKFLKAVIEGGLETKPDNVLIYATSNRRHIVRETWNDRGDMEHSGDIHRSDTIEEKLSLASRFGVTINYSAPSRSQYHEIVRELAKRKLTSQVNGMDLDDGKLIAAANQWELRHGGLSGRTAQQFIDSLSSC